MKKCTLFIFSLCLASFLSAQTFEAELPNEKLYSQEATGTGLSGEKGISFRDALGAYAKYTVTASQEGTYDLELTYVSMEKRAFSILVNNQIFSIAICDSLTGGWDGLPAEVAGGATIPGVRTKTIQIYLENGENTLQIGAYPTSSTDFSPNLDKFTITKSAIEIAKPVDQPANIELEAEAADVITNCRVGDFAVFSGLKGVKDLNSGNKSSFKFTNVQIPKAGVYDVLTYYTTMNGRYFYAKVNAQGKVSVLANATTPGWGDGVGDGTTPDVNYKRITMYFNQGTNLLEFGASDGWAPNIDRISIVKSPLDTIEIPQRVNEAFVSDFTELAETVTEQNVTSESNLDNLFDNDDNTTYVVNGVNSTQVTVKVKYPILLTYYGLAAKVGSAVSVENWTMEYSTDGATWEEVPVTGTVVDNNGFKLFTTSINKDNRVSAQYFRLTASGTGKVEIAEWQLHGLPYLSEEQNFPKDLTTNDAGEPSGQLFSSDDGFNRGGTWNEVYENTIDKNIATRFTITGKKTFFLQFTIDDPTEVKSYSIAVPWEYADRNPKSWIIRGYSAETEDWVVLDSLVNISFPGTFTTLFFNIKNPKLCYAYKLDVTANCGSNDVHIAKWQLYGESVGKVAGIPNIQADNTNGILVYSQKGGIKISSALQNEFPYAVYNMMGQMVIAGKCVAGSQDIALPAGIYIVKVNGSSTKAIVK